MKNCICTGVSRFSGQKSSAVFLLFNLCNHQRDLCNRTAAILYL